MPITITKIKKRYLPETPQLASSTKNTLFQRTVDSLKNAVRDVIDENNDVFGARNVIALVGERGSGKTSILNCFLSDICRDNTSGVYALPNPINPDAFRGESSILQLLVSYILKEVKTVIDEKPSLECRDDLISQIEIVNQATQFESNSKVKEYFEDQIDNLDNFSRLYTLKKDLTDLITKFLALKFPSEPKNCFLLVALDDFDIAPEKMLISAKQIINYLSIKNLIIIISYDEAIMRESLLRQIEDAIPFLRKCEKGVDSLRDSVYEKLVSPRRIIHAEANESSSAFYEKEIPSLFMAPYTNAPNIGRPSSIRRTNQQINVYIFKGCLWLNEERNKVIENNLSPKEKLSLFESVYQLAPIEEEKNSWDDYIFPSSNLKQTKSREILHNRLYLASLEDKSVRAIALLKPAGINGLAWIEIKGKSREYYKRSVFDVVERTECPDHYFDFAQKVADSFMQNDYNAYADLISHLAKPIKENQNVVAPWWFRSTIEVLSPEFEKTISQARDFLKFVSGRSLRTTKASSQNAILFQNWLKKIFSNEAGTFYFPNPRERSVITDRGLDFELFKNEEMAEIVGDFIERVTNVRNS